MGAVSDPAPEQSSRPQKLVAHHAQILCRVKIAMRSPAQKTVKCPRSVLGTNVRQAAAVGRRIELALSLATQHMEERHALCFLTLALAGPGSARSTA